jgi:ribosome biogenesis protein Tsr3
VFVSSGDGAALSSGLFETYKIWAVFSRRGVVLSSEASEYVSATDRDIVQSYGIAGIDCSWSRDLKKFPSSAWKRVETRD